MTTEFEMTALDLEELIDACKQVSCMKIGSYITMSSVEKGRDAWEKLGKKMGFEFESVRPIPGKDKRFFTAVPTTGD